MFSCISIRMSAAFAPSSGAAGVLPLVCLAGRGPPVEPHRVLLRARAASLLDLLVDRARDEVARGEVLHRGGVALHEALLVPVQQDAALAAYGLGEQDAHLVDAGRVELEELH